MNLAVKFSEIVLIVQLTFKLIIVFDLQKIPDSSLSLDENYNSTKPNEDDYASEKRACVSVDY